MTWQPIDDEAKNGAWIIAWNGAEVLPLCWVIEASSDRYTGWAYGDPGWGGVLYDGVNEVDRQPILYMKLPTPPEGSE